MLPLRFVDRIGTRASQRWWRGYCAVLSCAVLYWRGPIGRAGGGRGQSEFAGLWGTRGLQVTRVRG